MKRLFVIILTVAAILAHPNRTEAQQFDLNDIYFDYWDGNEVFYFQWVATGDTTRLDTLKNGAILFEIDGFYISRTEVTNGLWNKVFGIPDSDTLASLLPKTNVTAAEIDSFCAKLALATNFEWRLPTRDEWLFAYHGGIFSEGYKYSGSNKATWAGWYAANSHGRIHPVGEKIANEVHLHDMSGNVAELITDGETIKAIGGCYLDKKLSNTPTPVSNTPPEATGFRIACRITMSFMDTGL